MKKFFLSTIIAATLFVTPAIANEIFYDGGQSGTWSVFGNSGVGNQNPACVAQATWDDGSKFQIIKDLADGEFYIWFQNMQWDIADAPGDYPFRMNFESSTDGSVIGGNMTYTLVNKNTVLVRDIEVEAFVDAFVKKSEIRFIMPGDIQNSYIPLDGATIAVEKLEECVDVFEKKRPAPAQPPADQPKKSLGQEI